MDACKYVCLSEEYVNIFKEYAKALGARWDLGTTRRKFWQMHVTAKKSVYHHWVLCEGSVIGDLTPVLAHHPAVIKTLL